MKTFFRLALSGLIAIVGVAAFGAPVELMIKYKPNASPKVVNAMIGARTLNDIEQIGWQRVVLPATISRDRAVRYFRSLSTVAKVEPVGTWKAFATPNDPRYPQQYALPRVGMPGAWEYSLGSPEVVVAVVDSGVLATHEDLAANLVSGGYDYADGDDNVNDGFGHGTAVSGCVSAVTNNGVGIAGTAWNVKVYNVKVFSDGQLSGSFGPILEGLVDAADRGVRIINMSLGGPGVSDSIREAVDYALDSGSIVVASAGNEPTDDVNYPAGLPGVLSVGATDENDAQTDFTNFGATVDVAAPGIRILTTDYTATNSYGLFQGTSFSAPITSGALALMASYSPTSTNEELLAAIRETTVNVGDWLEFGRINVPAALERLNPPQVADVNPDSATVVANEGTIVNPTGSPVTDASYLDDVDSTSLELRSVYRPGLGTIAGVTTAFTVPVQSSQIITARLQMNLSAAPGVTALIMMQNATTGTFEIFNSARLTSATRAIDLPLRKASLARYLKSDGTVNLMIRTINPSRLAPGGAPFRASIDSAGLRITYRAL